jgi:hypothetical protein
MILPTSCRKALEALIPARSSEARAAVVWMIEAAKRMAPPYAEVWHAHCRDIYGEGGGQRGFARDKEVQAYLPALNGASWPTLIIALQTYFALICDVLAVARLSGPGADFVDGLTSLADRALRSRLRDIASAKIYREFEVQPATNPMPFDWYLKSGADLAAIRKLLEALAALDRMLPSLPGGADLLPWLYTRIMPGNLLHVLGEFYTPGWLAELLLDDIGWQPGQRLIDPYAGNGVFLTTVIQRTKSLGRSPYRVLGQLQAIEVNPVAYVALRASLILAVVDPLEPRPAIRLPIHCANALEHCLGFAHENIAPADVLVTNPPWVGWEYMPRAYRDRLHPGWQKYGLFTARGREAAFLKEDLSTLALIAAWDRYLKPGGRSAVVLRPASMQAHLAARGLRRLSLFPDKDFLCLEQIRLFTGMRPFTGAMANAAAWILHKGESTSFPVRAVEWRPRIKGWQAPAFATLAEVSANVVSNPLAAIRNDPGDNGAPWTLGAPSCQRASAALRGSNDFQGRTGVFTGGANAVYYLTPLPRAAKRGVRWYGNVVAGSKRLVASREFPLEEELVHEIIRGRDLELWRVRSQSHLLCPHTQATRMHAISPPILQKKYPRTFAYLVGMRAALEARQGFSGWEQQLRFEAFYSLQRVGDYSFHPFKTAWKYIASDFIVAVIGPGQLGKPRLCNDKIMYVGFEDEAEAYYLCGLLSSEAIRWRVTSSMIGTQISTSAIKHLHLPRFCAEDTTHRAIAETCRRGHVAAAAGDFKSAAAHLEATNRATAKLYALSETDRRTLRAELARKFGRSRFSGHSEFV